MYGYVDNNFSPVLSMNDNFSILNAYFQHLARGFGTTDDDRALHFVEVCAGSHRLTDAALDCGLKGHALDVPYWRL